MTLRIAASGAVVAAAAGFIVALRGGGAPSVEAPPSAAPGGGTAASSAARISVDPRALMVFAEASSTRQLVSGARVSAPERAPLRIADGQGTALSLDPGSSLSVIDLGQTRRFALLRGAVHAQVNKLVDGERFIIETLDAEVEVRGTAFRVETGVPGLACGGRSKRRRATAGRDDLDRTTTRVIVEEGVVSVRGGAHTERLYPGESWPPPCAGQADARRRVVRPSRSSNLSEQNDLFSAAVAARKAGDSARALELFERLIAIYPRSSLVEGAMAARMRLLDTNAGRGTAAAAYLARFPDGFARTEAAALLGAAERR